MQNANERTHGCGGTTFKIDRRYSDLKSVGKGSYGVVASAQDSGSNTRVAIKKISPMAAHAQDAKHILREVRLMRYLGVHENIITLTNLSMRDADDEIYIVMELLDSDLHRIIQSSQNLSDAHHRFFMYQLLKGVNYLHKHNVIHRDLKPGNLLVTRNCELRITDFGLARLKPTREGEGGEEIEEAMTEHVVTRWYRPPELMLCPDGLYTAAVDMWSVGCIFAELLGRKPLFPGKNFVHQLTLIFDIIGSPSPSQVSHIKSTQAKKFLASVKGKTKVDFETLYPTCNAAAVDLLKKLLQFEPGERLTAEQALNHPYFSNLKASNKTTDPPVSTDFEFDFEAQNLSRGRLKALIAEEVKGVQRQRRAADNQSNAKGMRAASKGAGVAAENASSGAKDREKEREREREREKLVKQKLKDAEEKLARESEMKLLRERRAERERREEREKVEDGGGGETPKVRGGRAGLENRAPNEAFVERSKKADESPPIPPRRKTREEGNRRYSSEAMLIAQGGGVRGGPAYGVNRGASKPTKSSAAPSNRVSSSAQGVRRPLIPERRAEERGRGAGERSKSAGGGGLYGGPVAARPERGAAAREAVADKEKERKRRVTVAKSPNFSKLRSERRVGGRRPVNA